MKKSIEWRTPKEYQDKRDVIAEELEEPQSEISVEPLPELATRKKQPKSKVCRRLKGPHVYDKWQPHYYGFEKDKTKPSGTYVRFCVGCNRKEMWFAPTKSGDFFGEPDLDARPPLDK